MVQLFHRQLTSLCIVSIFYSFNSIRYLLLFGSAPSLWPALMPSPRVYMDLVSSAVTGRIIIELFAKDAPKTCENFRCLCTGEHGPELCYKGSIFHRVIADPDFMVQGGDITNGDGTGGVSIYGETFADENLDWRHIDERGLVCMANRGPDTNSSQFFITLIPCPELDGKHIVFGRVIPESMHVLDMFANVVTDPENDDRPIPDHEPRIVQCGELIFKRKKGIAENDAISKKRMVRQPEVREEEIPWQSRRSRNRHSDEEDYSINRGQEQRSPRSPSEGRGRSDVASPSVESPSRSRSPSKDPQSVPKNPLMRAREGHRAYKDDLSTSSYREKGNNRAYGRTYDNSYDRGYEGRYGSRHEGRYERYYDDRSRHKGRVDRAEDSSRSTVKYKGRGTMKFIE
ncbi:cyclophilin-like domain-containing protein [Lipomyces starkeyi]